MAERSGEKEFKLYGREGYALVEGVTQFKYLGNPLDQMDDECPVVQRNVQRAGRVWGR